MLKEESWSYSNCITSLRLILLYNAIVDIIMFFWL